MLTVRATKADWNQKDMATRVACLLRAHDLSCDPAMAMNPLLMLATKADRLQAQRREMEEGPVQRVSTPELLRRSPQKHWIAIETLRRTAATRKMQHRSLFYLLEEHGCVMDFEPSCRPRLARWIGPWRWG